MNHQSKYTFCDDIPTSGRLGRTHLWSWLTLPRPSFSWKILHPWRCLPACLKLWKQEIIGWSKIWRVRGMFKQLQALLFQEFSHCYRHMHRSIIPVEDEFCIQHFFPTSCRDETHTWPHCFSCKGWQIFQRDQWDCWGHLSLPGSG